MPHSVQRGYPTLQVGEAGNALASDSTTPKRLRQALTTREANYSSVPVSTCRHGACDQSESAHKPGKSSRCDVVCLPVPPPQASRAGTLAILTKVRHPEAVVALRLVSPTTRHSTIIGRLAKELSSFSLCATINSTLPSHDPATGCDTLALTTGQSSESEKPSTRCMSRMDDGSSLRLLSTSSAYKHLVICNGGNGEESS